MVTEMVKMSPKGQLVVSQDIRLGEGFEPGDRFVQFQIKDGVLFKKVKIPDIKVEFEKISKEIEKKFRRQKVTEDDIGKAVKWAREK